MSDDASYAPLGAFEVLAPSLGFQTSGVPQSAGESPPEAIRMGTDEPTCSTIVLDFRHGNGRYRVTLMPDHRVIRVDQYYRDRWGNSSLRVIEGTHQMASRALVVQAARRLLERSAATLPTGENPDE